MMAYDAMMASRKNTAWKSSVQKFCWYYLQRISTLQRQLDCLERDLPGSYKPKPGYEFFVNERGRVRPITGQLIEDRVVSHALNDAVLMPAIKDYLIYDNTASIKGRGLEMARGRLRAHLMRFYQREGTNEGYIRLKDQSKYYDNILLKEAYEMLCGFTNDGLAKKLVRLLLLQNKLDVSYMTDEEYANCMEEKFDRVAYRIANHPMEGKRYMYKGVNVGDQLSQTIGIVYPYRVDSLVKCVLGSKYYARYMDDSYDIDKDKAALHERADCIDASAKAIGMHTNVRKTCVVRIDRYFIYLQHKVRLLPNGKVDERLRPIALARIRRRLRKLKAKVDAGIITEMDIVNLYKSWISARREFMNYPQLRGLELMMMGIYGRNVYEQIYDHDVRWRCA